MVVVHDGLLDKTVIRNQPMAQRTFWTLIGTGSLSQISQRALPMSFGCAVFPSCVPYIDFASFVKR